MSVPNLAQIAQFIAGFEGFRSMPYRDAGNGTWTIGYGETDPGFLAAHPNGVTEPEAMAQLGTRVEGFAEAVLGSIAPDNATDDQLCAMTSLAYNIGTGAFGGSSVVRLFHARDFAGAAEAFLAWDKAGGQVLPGLVARRQQERALFLSQAAAAPAPIPTQPQPTEDDTMARSMTDPKNGCKALVKPDGSVYAYNPDGSSGGHYLGGLNGHPLWNAGVAGDPAVAIEPWDDGNPALSGYVIFTEAADGFHPYAFPSDGSLAH